jgi:hypothetical protein
MRWAGEDGTAASSRFQGHSVTRVRTVVFALEVRISGKWRSNHGKDRPRRNRPFTWVSAFRTKAAKSGGPERMSLRRATFDRSRARPVNRSAPKTPGHLPLSAMLGQAESTARMGTGGWGGIRTHDTLLTYTHFPGARLRPLGHPSPDSGANPQRGRPYRRPRRARQAGC